MATAQLHQPAAPVEPETAIPARPTVPAAPLTPSQQQLRAAQDLFIRRWGEMGQTWGINRTMAEIHDLLYITAQLLCTDYVMERLHISRGNASMSLRALCDWGIIRRHHKRREMDPVLETIRQCEKMLAAESIGKAAANQETVKATRQRLASMEEFMGL